ncbi:MAG: patatin-like phospholipase family protein [Ectothiorhodospiraceae bacterium]|nr:patatin-like phospholipase family protein [Ectothiorhodospiraceae bacterium]
MNPSPQCPERPCAGLILSGGGARAAYQVGVLKAVAEILPPDVRNPFPIICGTSAGAINATVVATHAARFREGVQAMEAVWSGFSADQVYRTEPRRVVGRLARWLSALFFGGVGAHRPVSLLDNSPLAELLTRLLRFQQIEEAIQDGDLRALSITCSGYTSGQSVSFYQGVAGIQDWGRARRKGRRTRLGLQHLLASSAIPVVFPAVRIGDAYYGDGSVRQLAPISPALHMGADRVMVIGVSGNLSGASPAEPSKRYPTVAEILGHMLDSAFIDMLEGDLERLERINQTLSAIPEKVRRKTGIPLRPVQSLLISPSEDLDTIAARHAHELPRVIRFFLRGSGATQEGAGATVMSYLLFQAGFCQELIRLGYRDAWRRESEILRFLGLDPTRLHGPSGRVPVDVW